MTDSSSSSRPAEDHSSVVGEILGDVADQAAAARSDARS